MSDLIVDSISYSAPSTLSSNVLSFGTTGKISGVDSIEFANGSILKMPTASIVNEQKILVYSNGKLEWKDSIGVDALEERMIKNDGELLMRDYKLQNEIQQLREEIRMNNVSWQFTDYLSIFLIALLAIWFTRHISWEIVLTPIKKLFRFGKKKVKEAEEAWKEIE